MARRRRRRRSRRGGSPLLVLGGLLVGLAIITGGLAVIFREPIADRIAGKPSDDLPTGFASEGGTPPTDSAPPTYPAPPSAPSMTVGVIVDPSGSNLGPRQAEKDLDVLAQAIEDWAGNAPVEDQDREAIPGLDLYVRRVAGNAYSTAAHVATVHIAGQPAAPAPVLGGASLDLLLEYDNKFNDLTQKWNEAEEEASAKAKVLRDKKLKLTRSDIAGAVSAMAEELEGSEKPRIIVISDVRQANAAPQVSGRLAGVEVIVFLRCGRPGHPCKAKAKNAAKGKFNALCRKLGGADPTYIGVENLADRLPDAVKGLWP